MNEENRLQDNPLTDAEEASIDFKAMFGALKKYWKSYAIGLPVALIILNCPRPGVQVAR